MKQFLILFIIVILYLCLFVFPNISALQIDLQPGSYRCIGQQLDQEDYASFSIGANTIGMKKTLTTQKLIASIRDPDDNKLFEERIIIGSRPKEFLHDVEESGVYNCCFELESGPETVRLMFHIDFKSHEMESTLKVGKDDIPSLDVQLKAAEEALSEISKEIEFAREQELALREAGDSMTTRINRFGLFSISILTLTSLWQILYLRRFFTAKKLL